MRQKPPATQDLDEDKILWQRVTERVTPLAGRENAPDLKASPSPASTRKTSPTLARPIAPPSHPQVAAPVDLRQGDLAGLDGRTQRRLFRGDVPIDRRLDLHGYSAARAEIKLQNFIQDASYGGCRCVLVITGKGAGVLRAHVPDWLKRAPLSGLILAIAEARPTDGGSGAFYVLLRRRR